MLKNGKGFRYVCYLMAMAALGFVLGIVEKNIIVKVGNWLYGKFCE